MPAASVSDESIQSVIIVGAGIAGVRLALTLREGGFSGAVRLISDEQHLPYDRPPLSKSVLVDPEGHKHISLDPEQQLTSERIELLTGTRCVAIDRSDRAVDLASGARVSYDRLVLATGSTVRTVKGFPPGMPGVHYLRTLDDALALKRAAREKRRIAVIGAGVIGLEVAASLVSQGHRVTIVDPASRVMARSASIPLGEHLERRHRSEGVDIRLNTVVEVAEAVGDGFELSLSGGHTLSVDLVIIGVGVFPNDDLARSSGLETQPHGIVVNAQGRTSDAAIYAAGEVAFYFNDELGRHDRQETWAHAAAHGEHVARAILGADDGYREQSSYWTDQYDISVQVIGQPSGERDIIRGALAHGSGLIFHVDRDSLVGVSAINAVRELRVARRLIGLHFDNPSLLADTGVDLKGFL